MLLPASFSLAPLVEQINSGYKDTESLVVTVASIVEPFLSLQHRESISQVGILVNLLHIFLLLCTETMHKPLILASDFSQEKPQMIPGAKIDIMVEV